MRHLDDYCARVGSFIVVTVTQSERGRAREFADMMDRLECCVCRRLDGRGT